ncbi:MAG: DUF3307 domain-containing protein [Clostridia bacterium]
MYSELIITLLVLSHVLSHFYFQNEQIAKDKEKSKRVLIKHTLHFAISAFALTITFFSWELSIVIVMLSVLHPILDSMKIQLNKKYKQLSKLFYFIIDQILHILVILFIYPFIANIVIPPWSSSAITYLSVKYPLLNSVTYNNLTYCILASAFILFLANGGTIITKLFLELPSFLANRQINVKSSPIIHSELPSGQEIAAVKAEDPDSQMYRYGEVIGILERVTMFLLITSGHYEGITFVIAAKSIARFKQFEKHDFSDYYLVGTLASSLIAIIGGELFLIICNILKLL